MCRVKVIRNERDFRGLLKAIEKADSIGFDTESVGPLLKNVTKKKKKMLNVYKSRMVGASFAVSNTKAFYLPVEHADISLPSQWVQRALLAANGKPVYAHNWKHDMTVLSLDPGCKLFNQHRFPVNYRDSMVAEFVSGQPGPFGLKPLMHKYMDLDAESFEDLFGSKPLNKLKAVEVKRYAGLDAIATRKIGIIAENRLKQQGDIYDWYLNYETPFVRILQRMEFRGVGIAPSKLNELAKRCEKRIIELRSTWNEMFPGVHIGSPKQLREYFFGQNLWTTEGVSRSPKTKLYSTDRECLERQIEALDEVEPGYKAAALKLEYQDYYKVLSTYTRSLVSMAEQYPDKRLHGSFHHTGTKTGRLSSSGPNLQNFPNRSELAKNVLRAFRPSTGFEFISADYSQIELRILAHVSRDENLLAAYNNAEDIHQRTADIAGCTRKQAKLLNFGIVYGMGAKRLGRTLKTSEDEAEQFIHMYFKGYPKVQAYKNKMNTYCSKNGYTITLAHRRRYVPGIHSYNKYEVYEAQRIAGNTPIQGGAADIMKKAMVNLQKEIDKRGFSRDIYIVSQVHDDLVLESSVSHREVAKKLLRECMESAWELRVPLVAEPEVGTSLADFKE